MLLSDPLDSIGDSVSTWLNGLLHCKVLLFRQKWHGCTRSAIVLGAALEAIVRRVGQQQTVTVNADLVFGDYVLFFLV